MNDQLKFEAFKYFLECYFNVSANYEELDKVVNEFILSENNSYRTRLQAELERIMKHGDWENVQGIVKEFGMRKINEDKLKWLIQSILNHFIT